MNRFILLVWLSSPRCVVLIELGILNTRSADVLEEVPGRTMNGHCS